MKKQRKLFCEYNRLFYIIAVAKENLKRSIYTFCQKPRFAQKTDSSNLPCLIKGHRSLLLRPLLGVEMQYQHNKVHNLHLASRTIDGLVIQPGQTFSFWKLVGKPSKAKGYLPGMALSKGKVCYDTGGGICQLANMVHWLVLHSPLAITELHHHTDCIFPDSGRRVPFGTGTSVFYKNVDYQFKNTSEQAVQLRLWLDDQHLCGELRSSAPFPFFYRLVEQDSYFAYQGKTLYRNSKIYRHRFDWASKAECGSQLILNNHSEVLYDYSLVNPEQIRNRPQ